MNTSVEQARITSKLTEDCHHAPPPFLQIQSPGLIASSATGLLLQPFFSRSCSLFRQFPQTFPSSQSPSSQSFFALSQPPTAADTPCWPTNHSYKGAKDFDLSFSSPRPNPSISPPAPQGNTGCSFSCVSHRLPPPNFPSHSGCFIPATKSLT